MEDVGPDLLREPAAGTVFSGKYRVERVLGAGGMAVVVAARDLRLDRLVALKILRPAKSRDAELQRRFANEARLLARIQNEHVARILDVDTLPDGNQLLVLEYLEGEDLGRLIERTGPVEPSRAVDLVLQACEAVNEAHALGIVHRDLKPANLFLARQKDGSERVKVLDFGISKSLEPRDGDAGITTNSDVFGSPKYMSPEQLRSSRDVTGRTDVWALAVILYELVSGRIPFAGAGRAEIIGAILHEKPVPLIEVDARAPLRLWQAIERALTKDTSLRTASVLAFAGEIVAFGGDQASASLARMRRVASTRPQAEDDGATLPPAQTAEETPALAGSSALGEWADGGSSEGSVSSAWLPARVALDTGKSARRRKRALGLLAAMLTAGALVYVAAYPPSASSQNAGAGVPVPVRAPAPAPPLQASSALASKASESVLIDPPPRALTPLSSARVKTLPASKLSRMSTSSPGEAARTPAARALAFPEPQAPASAATAAQSGADCPDPFCDRK